MTETSEGDRHQREEQFWDQAFAGEEFHQRPQRRFYSVTTAAFGLYDTRIDSVASGTQVLEYGCGPGSRAFRLARRGARVTGIDISSIAIERAREQAKREGLADRLKFEVMDCEHLEFEEDSFDLICGTGILHHIDLERGYRELSRTLKARGSAIFVEPMGHNPLIEAYRRRTPNEHTPDEHPLRVEDLRHAERHFIEVNWRFFTLLGLAAVPFRNVPGFEKMVNVLDATDRALFKVSPGIAKQAWLVLLEMSKPSS